jgi:hypothetical protein
VPERVGRDQIDSAFRGLGYLRALERLGPRALDAGTWRPLAPMLSITERPPAGAAAAIEGAWAAAPENQRRLAIEGYLVSPVAVDLSLIARLRDAVTTLVAQGFPPMTALLYDEVYQLYAGISRALAPVLGDDAMLLLDDAWAFFVPPADPAFAHWTAFPPHRDWLGGDERLMRGGLPTALQAWVAMTDVTTDDSCLYVVPADADGAYRSPVQSVTADQFRLQDVRAVPVSRGQIIVFSTHLTHWGSRSSQWASGPRISTACFLQSRELAQDRPGAVDLREPVPFAKRLQWMLTGLRIVIGKDEASALAAKLGVTLGTSPTSGY